MKRGVYETKTQPNKATFKYELEGKLFLVVAKVEGKDETITGKHCSVFDYTGNKIVTIDAYKNNPKVICKNKEAYFVVITMRQNN